MICLWEKGNNVPSEKQRKEMEEILGELTSTPESDSEADSQTPIAAWLSRAIAKKDLTVVELAAKAKVSVPTVYNILSGRAQNPQNKTITSLEKVLSVPFESKKESKKASEIVGIGQLIDFNPHDQLETPKDAGVYVLYDITQRPIYVGKSNNIYTRLRDHRTRSWFIRPFVETGAYIKIEDQTLRDQVETVLIQFLKSNAIINKQKTVREED
jgi:ribosome-binding protein aMBF1 (putative translation factor)